ncbi:unnamed protein product [Oreochromis niloticus]|nr:unnamed protein product [Mustela putorius furo]
MDDDSRGPLGSGYAKDNTRQTPSEPTRVNMEIILQEIQEFRKENNTQLEDIKGEIHKSNRRIGEVENRIEAAETRVQILKQVLKHVKAQAQHNEKLVDQEGRARRDNLRIYNVPENEEGDLMISFVEKLIRENLDIPPGTEVHIERAHRALAPKPASSERPRSIVIKFHHYKTKEDILSKAWIKKDIVIKNLRIYFDHDYPTAVLNKRKEYNEVKWALKENKILCQTPYPARLRVFYEEGTRFYHSAEEATKDLKDCGFPVKVIPPPVDPMEQLTQQAWGIAGEKETTRPRAAAIRDKLQVY